MLLPAAVAPSRSPVLVPLLREGCAGNIHSQPLSGSQPDSQDHPPLILWGILRPDLDLPPRGSSAAATAVWQLRGVRVRHSNKILQFPAEML